ncbi:MAG: CRISPR-associated endonuclease Cas2 [Lactobacillaceae bacterium]|jgi:CRISPR-associated protein Cas2|nr:CRISPR-associated endonuclease Cas2 [Lactobacillaceae bacterium]
MAKEGERYMRMLVFFDLPTLTKTDRRNASRFRNFLVKDGYIMLQLSVYSRICKGQDDVEKHAKRLKGLICKEGSVRLLTVTEKQYASMEILVGTLKKEEELGDKQLLLL